MPHMAVEALNAYTNPNPTQREAHAVMLARAIVASCRARPDADDIWCAIAAGYRWGLFPFIVTNHHALMRFHGLVEDLIPFVRWVSK